MISHEIIGDDMQAVVISLAAGDEIRAEAGAMTYMCTAATAKVAFSAPYPGKIIRFPLQSSAVLCQRQSFLCATGEININVEFTKRLGAGFFGGEGLFFATVTGPGRVWIQTLPFSRLADRILSAFHGSKEEVRRGDLGGAIGAIGDIISGDR